MEKNGVIEMEVIEILEEELDYQRRREARRRRIEERRRKESFLHKMFCLAAGTVIFAVFCLGLVLMSEDFGPKKQEVIEVEETFVASISIDELCDSEGDIVVISEDAEPAPVVHGMEEGYVVSFTDDERLLFEQVLAAESYSYWEYSDLLSLATVVMNRVQSEEYPDSLEGVLTQSCQFEVYSNGRYEDAEVTDACRQAVEDALKGEKNLNSEVKFFCTKAYYDSASSSDYFKGLEHVYTCRNVYFFTKK